MPEYVYSIILVVIIVVVMMWWVSKKKSEVWKGELIKKSWNPGDMDNSPSYTLIFKTEEGKKKKFHTPDQRYYDTWEIGDRAEKVKGDFFPKKV
jgi:hypothetical protein